jgi:glycosyltransferase involved in cell wall biosynthesis
MPAVAIIVPAHNEAGRIGAVLQPLIESGAGRVIVIDDGSTDETAAQARAAGAQVITLTPNRGKGGALLAGVRATHEPVVAFFDADLIGLTPEHVRTILAPVLSGQAVMSVGLRDYGMYNELQKALPYITGERAVLRSVLEKVQNNMWSGWRVEAGINEAARCSGDVAATVMPNLRIVTKWEKQNISIQQGLEDGLNMLVSVLFAMIDAKEQPPSLRERL